MRLLSVWLLLMTVLACGQTPETPAPAPKMVEETTPEVKVKAPEPKVEPIAPVKYADNVTPKTSAKPKKVVKKAPPKRVVPKAKAAKASAEMKACQEERRMQEKYYQKVLNAKHHRQCSADSDCILLPATTQCGQAVCFHERAAANKKNAKKIKAIQYEADRSACPQWTRQCEPVLHAQRIQTRCKADRQLEGRCEKNLCVAKTRRPRPRPKANRRGAQLFLGNTKTSDGRYKMSITESLTFGRNAAFTSCKDYGGSQSGDATFEFTVTPRGTLGSLRIKTSSMPKRMALCLRTWLKGHSYPKPKAGSAKVSQTVRYVAP